MRNRLTARKRLDRKWPQSESAKASDYLSHFADVNAIDVVLLCRVSGIDQHRNDNLTDQATSNRRTIEQSGAVLHEVYRCIESGWDNNHWMDRPTLAAAAAKAKELGAVLVVESTSRLIRSRSYDPKRSPHAQPTKHEYEQLMKLVPGVTVATIVHPDASPGEERSYQTKRGQESKGRKGGRPQLDEQIALRRAVVEVMKRLPH